MDIDLFIRQRGLDPQEKISSSDDSYWTLKELLEDLLDRQNKEYESRIDNTAPCGGCSKMPAPCRAINCNWYKANN